MNIRTTASARLREQSAPGRWLHPSAAGRRRRRRISERSTVCASTVEPTSRIAELDLLRAVAVFLVLGRHLHLIPEWLPPVIRYPLLFWRQIGWLGVDLFFVLSGFLVSGLLFRDLEQTGSIHARRFLVRRALKLYPAFYCFVFTSIITAWFAGLPSTVSLPKLLGEMFFLQNYADSLWQHTWSLAVEEHFYILLVATCCFLMWFNRNDRAPLSVLPYLILFVGIACLTGRLSVAFTNPPGSWRLTLLPTHLRLDGLGAGVLFGYWYHFKFEVLRSTVRRYRRVIMVILIVSLMPCVMFKMGLEPVMYSLGFSLSWLASVCLLSLLLFADDETKAKISARTSLISGAGRYSYSTYLWHLMIYYISLGLFPVSSGSTSVYCAHVATFVAGSFVVGAVMSKIIELPVLRWRDRHFPPSISSRC